VRTVRAFIKSQRQVNEGRSPLHASPATAVSSAVLRRVPVMMLGRGGPIREYSLTRGALDAPGQRQQGGYGADR
jgi:hypothetical protein